MSRRLIWGEAMESKRSVYRNGISFEYYLLFIGFVVGMLLPNLMYKMEWKQDMAAALYLMGIYAEESGMDYFWKVVRMRGGILLLAAGSGLTIFGVPIAAGGVILFGMQTAMLVTMSILQFGLYGGVIGAGLLFPQILVYLPCVLAASGIIYESSMKIWKNRNFLPGQISAYILKMTLCIIGFGVGILLEAYCNPMITRILIRNLKIF